MSTAQTQVSSNLTTKLQDRTAEVVVIGLGYVGLPLAVEVARAGFHVTGLEVSEKKTQLVTSGLSDIDDVSEDLLAPLVRDKRLTVTLDPNVLDDADCVVICVPTPLSKAKAKEPDMSFMVKEPDMSFIRTVVENVAKHVHRDMLIVLESTTYPGTTEEEIRPALEASGLNVGQDFYLAFSPERVDPGNPTWGTKNTPRIVGGCTPACTRMAAAFYGVFLDKVVQVSSTRAAEMVKLLENTFRWVNIGFINEFALICAHLKLDIWEIIDAASTKPFGFMPFYPGPGLGGHCIPIDPYYLRWKLKSENYPAKFIELAGEINNRMPDSVVKLVTLSLNDDARSINGANILILGVAYKRDISDVRESPSLDIIKKLQSLGATVSYSDPHVPRMSADGLEMVSVPADRETLTKSDCVVIVTDHARFDYGFICGTAKRVVDCRNATRGICVGNIRRL